MSVETKTITIQVQLTDQEAWQLAQCLKRMTFGQVLECATTNDEAYVMVWAIAKIRKQLAEQGYAPR